MRVSFDAMTAPRRPPTGPVATSRLGPGSAGREDPAHRVLVEVRDAFILRGSGDEDAAVRGIRQDVCDHVTVGIDLDLQGYSSMDRAPRLAARATMTEPAIMAAYPVMKG